MTYRIRRMLDATYYYIVCFDFVTADINLAKKFDNINDAKDIVDKKLEKCGIKYEIEEVQDDWIGKAVGTSLNERFAW